MSYSEETARIILGAWLGDEHTEDMSLIPVSRFPVPFDAVAKDLRGGAGLPELIRRHGSELITGIAASYSPILYQVAVQSTLAEEMLATIPAAPSPGELIAHAEKFQRIWESPPKPVPLAAAYWDAIDERAEMDPIASGIPLVDECTYGIYPGQLTIVGARPSVGKSAFCLQVAWNVARKGHKVLFLPLEMSAAETVDRLVMRFAGGVRYKDLRRGKMSPEQIAAVTKVVDEIDSKSELFKVYEDVRDLSAIKSLIQNEKPELVVIDQLSQVRTGSESQTIRERYVEITRTLKAIALEEKTAIWLPCQMNRESSKTGSVTIDYLKESGSIEEDADIVLILSRVKDESGERVEGPDGRAVTLEVAKNRQGRLGKEELIFVGSRFTFRSQTQRDMYETTGNEIPFEEVDR